ncbi:MAG: sulfatase-like hydrolase/transferase, partial [bacterium]|nr:sulfatase-like hydrolase/transferase [bacterium]
PNIDALAADGLLFRNAYSAAPWTLPAVSSSMTGHYPSAHGASRHLISVPDAAPTLAERLSAAGYATGAVVVNDWLRRSSGLSRGFQDYHVLPPSHKLGFAGLFYRLLGSGIDTDSTNASTVTKVGTEWLRSHSGDDFFLWLHYLDLHSPYRPPERYLAGRKPPDWVEPVVDLLLTKFLVGDVFPSAEQVGWMKRLYLADVRYVDAVGVARLTIPPDRVLPA